MNKLHRVIELLEGFAGDLETLSKALAILRELRDQPKSGAEILMAWRARWPKAVLWNDEISDLASRIDDALVARQDAEPETQREHWQRVADLRGRVITGDEDGKVIEWLAEEPGTRLKGMWTDKNLALNVLANAGTWTDGQWQERIVRARGRSERA